MDGKYNIVRAMYVVYVCVWASISFSVMIVECLVKDISTLDGIVLVFRLDGK